MRQFTLLIPRGFLPIRLSPSGREVRQAGRRRASGAEKRRTSAPRRRRAGTTLRYGDDGGVHLARPSAHGSGAPSGTSLRKSLPDGIGSHGHCDSGRPAPRILATGEQGRAVRQIETFPVPSIDVVGEPAIADVIPVFSRMDRVIAQFDPPFADAGGRVD